MTPIDSCTARFPHLLLLAACAVVGLAVPGVAQEEPADPALPVHQAGSDDPGGAAPGEHAGAESSSKASLNTTDAEPGTLDLTNSLTAAGARVLPLSLDAALTHSETNNLGLKLEDISTEVARFNAAGGHGQFDWVFGSNFEHEDFERPPIAAYEGNSQVTGTRQSYGVSLTRALETGGTITTDWGTERKETIGGFANFPRETSQQLSMRFSQPLLRGFGLERGMSEQRESEVLFLQQMETRRQTRQRLLRDTADAYWDLVQKGRQLQVASSSLDLGEEQLLRNQRLLDAGVGTEVEVIQAEAEVATRGETKLAAELAVKTAEDALKALVFPGKDTESWNRVLQPTTPLPEVASLEGLESWTVILERALRKRPELRQTELEIQLAKLRHERAISDRHYGLDFTSRVVAQGNGPHYDTAQDQVRHGDAITWAAGLTLEAPIQNRTRVNAERAAREQVKAARIRYEQQETAIVAEVRDAVRQLRYQSMAVAAAGESLRAARRQLEAEVARYENDLSTNFQVLEYQLRLVEAMNNVQTSRANYAKSLYQLRAAEGTLGER